MLEHLEPSARVALAALLPDVGKFAERARLDFDREQLESFKQLDCPNWDGRWTHIHAAYTTAGFFTIEKLLPRRERLMGVPFAGPEETNADDSVINAAARHHRPGTLMQWIIATADRVASGFERSEFDPYNQADEGTATGKNHYQARLLPLFESIAPDGDRSRQVDFCLPLRQPDVVARSFRCLLVGLHAHHPQRHGRQDAAGRMSVPPQQSRCRPFGRAVALACRAGQDR